MGINGLLPIVKPICEQKHVREFARTRVGVDVYGWLHRGTFSCASKLCKGMDTRQFIDFCMHRIRMLLHFNITPVLIFDGAALPMKNDTHAERREKRQDALQRAQQAEAAGNLRLAEECYQKAVEVNPEMARGVIRECRKLNIEYIVAPYEADAQLAWLSKNGLIDSVITEDSDLLVYGAEKILYKMTKNGDGDLFQRKNLPSLDSLSMINFTEDMFMYMCICSGCDFFKGVQGLGIKKSHGLVKKTRTMTRLIHLIRNDRRYPVTRSFTTDFARACLVFRHQTVYDPVKSKMTHLNPFDSVVRSNLPAGVLSEAEDGTPDLGFLGIHRDDVTAKKIAQSLVHPSTLKEYSEPLDQIARPIGKTVDRKQDRPELTHAAPSPREVPEARKFQIQPMMGPARHSKVAAASLRHRLGIGPTKFDPKKAGRDFKRKASSSELTSRVWSKFARTPTSKRQRTIAGALQTNSNGKKEERSSAVVETGQTVSTGVSGPIPEPEIEDENQTESAVPSSVRTEAINRAVNRFATRSAEHTAELAAPTMQSSSQENLINMRNEEQDAVETSERAAAPPSPDHESYEMFTQIDDELSREDPKQAKEERERKVARMPTPKQRRVEGSRELWRSRFFEQTAKRNATSPNATNYPSLPFSRKSERNATSSTPKRLPRGSATLNLDKFRRGATGKKIGADEVKR